MKQKRRRKEKVYAFLDSQNLNMGIKSLGWKLDYKKFRTYIRNKYHVEKAYLFIGYVKENSDLYAFLQEAGFILVFKPVLEIEKHGKTTYKGNVDAELVLHAMIHYDNYDKAVIVSGDGDFFCLVDYLAKSDKLKKIIVPNQKYSSLLRKYAKFILPLNLAKKKLEYKG